MFRSRALLAGLATSFAVAAISTAPAGAQTPSKPTVRTNDASRVTATTARLNGRVNPNGQSTTYSFQYGTSTKYGASTPAAPAGSGTKEVPALADIGGLKPNTAYHFRIVASNATGVSSGADRTFRTAKVPLSLGLTATPNPVPFGSATVLTGALSGTGGGGRTIQIQQEAFPFTTGFANYGNPLVTAADGTFSLPVAGLVANAQFRAITTEGKQLASPTVMVGVAPVVRTEVSTTRPRRGQLVRFAGSITPRWIPAQVAIQKRASDGRWITVAGTITRSLSATKAKYAKRVRVRRGGTYRVFVGLMDSRYAPSTGREIKLRLR
jgi:hypothetical protein